eukprot:c8914_g2_i1 orf=55-222(+)
MPAYVLSYCLLIVNENSSTCYVPTMYMLFFIAQFIAIFECINAHGPTFISVCVCV